MPSNRVPFFIIGGIVVIIALAVTAYVVSQNAAAPAPAADTGTQNERGNQSQEGESQFEDESDEQAGAEQVEIKDHLYGPETITVKAGTTVTWTNQDTAGHTVTTENGAPEKIDSGLFGKGESFSFTFEKAGTYQYFCEPHPYMKGTVVVTE